MSERLSKKEKGFVKDFVKTGNGTKSALNNYNTGSENVAASIASENLRKPKIQNAIKSIAESIPDSLLIKKHLELLNATTTIKQGEEYEEKIDAQAVKAGLDMAYKLKGNYAAEKSNVVIEDSTDSTKVKELMAKLNDQKRKR